MIQCRTIPIFDVDIYLVSSMEEARTFIKGKNPDEDTSILDGCVGICYTVTDATQKNHRMLCVFDGEPNTVVHESVHMARIVLKYCGVRFTQAQDEPLAYMVAWLADEMLKFIKSTKDAEAA